MRHRTAPRVSSPDHRHGLSPRQLRVLPRGTGKLVSLRRPGKQQESEGDAPSQQRRSHLGDWGAGTEETEARARPGRAFERSRLRRLRPQTGSHRRLIRPASNSAAAATTAVASAVAVAAAPSPAPPNSKAHVAPPLALTEVRRIVEEEQDALRRLSEEEALLGNRIRQAGPTRRAEQAHSSRQCGRRHRTARARWRGPACSRRPSCGPPRRCERSTSGSTPWKRARTPCLALARRPRHGSRGLREFRGLEVERTRPEHVV